MSLRDRRKAKKADEAAAQRAERHKGKHTRHPPVACAFVGHSLTYCSWLQSVTKV